MNTFALIKEGNKNMERKSKYYYRVLEKYWLVVPRKRRTTCWSLEKTSFIKSQLKMPEWSLYNDKQDSTSHGFRDPQLWVYGLGYRELCV